MLEEIVELHKQGKLEEAEQRYRELLTFNPDDPETLHLLGMVRRQRGDLVEGIRLVSRAIELAPDRANYYGTLAGMEFHGRLFDRAREHFEKAVELNPNFGGAHSALGQIAMLQGDKERAESHFKIALRANENQPQVLNSYGNLFLSRGDFPMAVRYISRAAELSPDDPAILASLGRAYLKQGHGAFAEQALLKALEKNPDFEQARLMLAQAQSAQGRNREAERTLVPMLVKGKLRARAIGLLGDIARAENDFGRAITRYREALELERNQPAVVEALAFSLAKMGYRREAAAAWREHLTHSPQDREARRMLVSMLVESGQAEEATRELESVIAADASDLEAKGQLANLYEAAGQLDRAEQLTDEVLRAQPGSFAPRVVKSRAALRKGHPQAAVRLLEGLDDSKLRPAQKRLAAGLLGQAYDKLGDAEAAVKAWLAAHAAAEQAKSLPHAEPVPRQLDDVIRQAAERGPIGCSRAPRALLVGTPGSGVERVAALLADAPEAVLLADRFANDQRRDEFAQPRFTRYVQGMDDSEARLFARHYEKPLDRMGVPADRALIDWLPHFDAWHLPAIHRSFGPTPIIVVTRDSKDALLDWLAFGGAHQYRIDDLHRAADWLTRARSHIDTAERVGAQPVLTLDSAEVLRDPVAAIARLAKFVGIASWTPGAAYARSGHATGGLPSSFETGHYVAYRDALKSAFVRLD